MVISVVVKVHCKEDMVVLDNGIYYVYTKSPAIEGKANSSVISLLSKYFDIPKSCVQIKSGLRFKKKVVEISM